MINTDKLINIKSEFGEYVGKVAHDNGTRTILMEVCQITMTKQGHGIQIKATSMDRNITFQGSLVMLELKEKDQLYGLYIEARTGIKLANKLPGNGRN
jgi:hypothetical protein